MDEWKKDRVGSAEAGTNPMVIAKLESGYAVMGDTQFLPGYCVLLASPQVDRLSALALPSRTAFLRDMSLLGEAIELACKEDGLRRVNYEILGNTDTFLHAHIFPRFDWEEAERVKRPVFLYPRENWTAAENQYDETRHGALRKAIKRHLESLASVIVEP
jgi:diadenosine tetraphosphate (Ap4A) HIT family hydrolase